jgi:hypothetical protein
MIRSFIVAIAVVVCWSAVAAAQPTATPTPDILNSISLSPDEAKNKTISVGEFANFTATGHYQNGTTKNLTQRVDYTSSDPTVAEAPNTEGNKGKVNGLAPGVVTITAVEPLSGISSNDTGGVNGHLTVQAALVSIVLKPLDKNAAVGEFVTYTATGILADNTAENPSTKNLTQKVEYKSTNNSVAVCPNTEGNRSRCEAVGIGTAIITATFTFPDQTTLTSTAEDSGTLTVREPGATPTGPTPARTPSPGGTPTLCGDPNDTGTVTVSDGVEVLNAAASLPSDCTTAVCDVDGSGSVSVTDGVLVLRSAAGLDDGLHCE